MPQPNSQPFEIFEDDYPKEFPDYKLSILRQIDAIRRLLTEARGSQGMVLAEGAIEILESLLKELIDNKYKNQTEQLSNEFMMLEKGMTEEDKQLKYNSAYRTFLRRRYELLLSLATRNGLTIMKRDFGVV